MQHLPETGPLLNQKGSWWEDTNSKNATDGSNTSPKNSSILLPLFKKKSNTFFIFFYLKQLQRWKAGQRCGVPNSPAFPSAESLVPSFIYAPLSSSAPRARQSIRLKAGHLSPLSALKIQATHTASSVRAAWDFSPTSDGLRVTLQRVNASNQRFILNLTKYSFFY